MQEACAAASDLGAGQELLALHGFVDYSCLLPRCSAMVHHGGAGTVAAALRAGIPSVICPLHFDQYMWVRHPHIIKIARCRCLAIPLCCSCCYLAH